MSKQLYEEALADAKKLKEVAEDNAKRALVEAVTPRIRDLIEKELLREFEEFDEIDDQFDDVTQEVPGAPGTPDLEGDLMTDEFLADEELPATALAFDTDEHDSLDSMSLPDEEGKITLDLDALTSDSAGAMVEPPMFAGDFNDEDEYELNLESIASLNPIITATKSNKQFETRLKNFSENLKKFSTASKILKESRGYSEQIVNMISQVENMYEYVQTSVQDTIKKNSYEMKLETHFKELNKLKEHDMSKKGLKKLMNEGEVTLKLTGLPEDLDLDSVGVDLITGEDESEDFDMDVEDVEGEDDMDLDLDFGDEDETEVEEEPEETTQVESRHRRFNDNTVVEIDENVLRREILRMKKMREAGERREDDLDLEMDESDDSREDHGNVAPRTMGRGAETSKQRRSIPESKKHTSKAPATARNGASRNGSPTRPTEQMAETNLRNKLAETNLFNAKLIYTNKLLQNESLSKRQKAEIIGQLDEAKNLREVKLVYESLSKTLAGTSRPLSESADRKVMGSASRTTRPASTNLNEGYETDRWSRLAGINK